MSEYNVAKSPREVYAEIKTLLEKAGIEGAAFEADILISEVCGASRFLLGEVSPTQYETLIAFAQRRAKREPLQYILGCWSFLSLELQVGEGVLIPRPETEQVCDIAADFIRNIPSPKLMDLCSGSGAIALGVHSLVPNATVLAVEWDEDAFVWLQKNMAAYNAQHVGSALPSEHCPEHMRPTAVRADALKYWKTLHMQQWDVITCNPPYVTQAEYEELQPELYHEPKQALVPQGGESDGLLFYKVIAEGYKQALKAGGAIVFEIGAGQGEDVAQIMHQNGYKDVTVHKDMAGLNRVVTARV